MADGYEIGLTRRVLLFKEGDRGRAVSRGRPRPVARWRDLFSQLFAEALSFLDGRVLHLSTHVDLPVRPEEPMAASDPADEPSPLDARDNTAWHAAGQILHVLAS